MARLRDEIETGSPDAVHRFWEELEAEGTPIVEALERSNRKVMLTFVLQSSSEKALENTVFDFGCHEFASEPLLHIRGTDIKYQSIVVRSDTRLLYRIKSPIETSASEPENAHHHSFRRDPLNSRFFAMPKLHADGFNWEWSLAESPKAGPAFFSAEETAAEVTRIHSLTFQSELLDKSRKLWLLVPHNTKSSTSDDLVIFLDGGVYVSGLRVPKLLNWLIGIEAVHPFTTAFLDIVDFATRPSDYLCNSTFSRVLATDVPRFVNETLGRSRMFDRVFLVGSSFGGVAAVHAVLSHSANLHGALCQSGSFWWNTRSDAAGLQIFQRLPPTQPIARRFVFTVGRYESTSLEPNTISVREGVRRISRYLRQRGNNVEHMLYSGGHDFLSWRANLPQGLQYLLH